MATDRSITVYVDSGTDSEKTLTLMRRLMAHGESAGTCVGTYGAVSVGTRADQVKITVGSGGSNTVSISLLVDSGVTNAKWLELIGRVIDACLAAGTCYPVFAASYTAGSRTDSLTLTIA